MEFLLRILLIVAALSASACGSKAPPAFFKNPHPLLTWLGEFTRPAGSVYPQLADSSKFGSISGLAPDEKRGQWIAVIDDREQSRVAWLNVGFGAKGLEVTPVRMQALERGTWSGSPPRHRSGSRVDCRAAEWRVRRRGRRPRHSRRGRVAAGACSR